MPFGDRCNAMTSALQSVSPVGRRIECRDAVRPGIMSALETLSPCESTGWERLEHESTKLDLECVCHAARRSM